MSILRKPLSDITIADLDELIASETRETGELEFKGDLPFVPKKGQPATADRWIEKGDRVGSYARDEILAEIVAFANADGGTLILGMHETKDEPRRAERLEPLPNCEGLVKRLVDATEDIIEPRLAAITARALPVDDAGCGYVLLRVGKSLFGPHRLTTTREFYIRRGERASTMAAREIRDHTLNLARAGDQVTQIFEERFADAQRQYSLLRGERHQQEPTPPFIIQVAAAPMSPQYIDRLTSKPNLWWMGNQFSIKIEGLNYLCGHPAREFGNPPEFRLRALTRRTPRAETGLSRIVRSDGLIEFTLHHPWRDPNSDGSSRLHFMWLYGLVVGAFSQIRHLQTLLAWDAVDYGMQIAIFGAAPISMVLRDDWYNSAVTVKEKTPLRLPTYEIGFTTNLDGLLSAISGDIYNACGTSTTVEVEVAPGTTKGVS